MDLTNAIAAFLLGRKSGCQFQKLFCSLNSLLEQYEGAKSYLYGKPLL